MLNISFITRALLASRFVPTQLHFAPFSTSAVNNMGLPSPVAPNTPKAPGQGPPKIHLYTQSTPNGYKPSIALEELRAAYPELAKTKLSYDVYLLDFSQKQQKDPEYLKINPNGRIPAIVDDNAGGLNVFESANVLLWLAEQYDTDFKFSFKDDKLRSKMLSWIFFAQGGPGPMMGQLGVFLRNEEKIPFAIKRYADESERLLSVYEDALQSADYLVDNKYSIADMNAFTWVSIYPPNAGIDTPTKFPKVQAWLDRIAQRPAVKEGFKVPKDRVYLTDEEKAAKRKELEGFLAQA